MRHPSRKGVFLPTFFRLLSPTAIGIALARRQVDASDDDVPRKILISYKIILVMQDGE